MSDFKFTEAERERISLLFRGYKHYGNMLDSAIQQVEQIINDRPSTDQDGAEGGVLSIMRANQHHRSEISRLESELTEAKEALKAKDAEVEKYFNESQKLATKHGKLYGKALAELTAAKKRIEELENRTEMKLPHNYKPQ